MRLKRLKKSTCFAFGAAGALLSLLGGVLMALGIGAAQYAHTGALVLMGGTLLLLATFEKGPQNKPRRVRLLLLFFLLLLANLRLPPLDFLEVPVLPLLALLYGQKGDGRLVLPLLVLEFALALLRTLAITGRLGGQPLLVVGLALAATAVLRFAALLRLNRRAAKNPEAQNQAYGLRR